MRRLVVCAVLFLSGCPETPPPSTGTVDTTSPKDSPVAYRVLKDETVNNSVEYHALVADGTKHDEVGKLLEFLYRHVMTRKEDSPAAVACYVYTTEAAYQTPPRTPIATMIRKSGELGPTAENKVPFEFWQEVKMALEPRRDEKWKLSVKVDRDDVQKTVTITTPYTEPGEDRWAKELSYNQAMQTFTDTAQALFDKVPDLRAMTYSGVWNDKEVLKISLARADYNALKLNEIDDRIGQHHGRAFLELSTGKGTDKSVAKENANLVAKEYRAMLGQLKGRATVSPTLK